MPRAPRRDQRRGEPLALHAEEVAPGPWGGSSADDEVDRTMVITREDEFADSRRGAVLAFNFDAAVVPSLDSTHVRDARYLCSRAYCAPAQWTRGVPPVLSQSAHAALAEDGLQGGRAR